MVITSDHFKAHKVFLDDERFPPDESWTLVKNSRAALILLDGLKQQNIRVDHMSFDHDLSTTDGIDDTSIRVMEWFCEPENRAFWPKRVYIHTGNPVGEANLVAIIRNAMDHGWCDRSTLAGFGFNLWKHEHRAYRKD